MDQNATLVNTEWYYVHGKGTALTLSVCLSVCLPACLPVCLSVCMRVCLPACLSVCLSVRLSFIIFYLSSTPDKDYVSKALVF